MLNELERIESIGEEPKPSYATFTMERNAAMYDDGDVDLHLVSESGTEVAIEVH